MNSPRIKKHPLSIGIMAHNEEANIKNAIMSILNQTLLQFIIEEIIIVSSGSSDHTNEIVGRLSHRIKIIKLICEKNRSGKYQAINLFQEKAKSNYLVLASADILLTPKALEYLCTPLLNSNIGISAARIIPLSQNNRLLDKIVKIQWELHHHISLIKPKYGELIAFKNIFSSICPTSVDEEEIASIIDRCNLKGAYAPDALVNNIGPNNIKEFFGQRSRIYAGHLDLKRRTGYISPTLNHLFVLKVFLKNFEMKCLLVYLAAAGIEMISRLSGFFIFHLSKQKNHSWKIAQSTKKNLMDLK